MNIVYFDDENFTKTDTYQRFIRDNSGFGFLNIRAYGANSAIPIANMKVEVSKIIDNIKVIFFEGKTDSSGNIYNIKLPSPLISNDDLEIPSSIEYNVDATYNNEVLPFFIKIYSNIQVVQNINVVPSMRLDGNYYGS